MHILFEQVTKIAKRGRKRWLSLAFVTQLPGHLPRQLFGLVNGYILHKITDPQVVAALIRAYDQRDRARFEAREGVVAHAEPGGAAGARAVGDARDATSGGEKG